MAELEQSRTRACGVHPGATPNVPNIEPLKAATAARQEWRESSIESDKRVRRPLVPSRTIGRPNRPKKLFEELRDVRLRATEHVDL